MALTYFQLVSTRSPGSAGFGQEGAACTEKYRSDAPLTLADIQDEMRALVGDVDLHESGRLQRTPPKAHPFYPWLVARDVQISMLGVRDSTGNEMSVVDADVDLYLPPITDSTIQYATAELTVTFEPRVYDILLDEDIEPDALTYFLTTDDTTPTGSGIDSAEYLRFVDQEITPAPTLASFQLGQLVFRTATGAAPGGTGSGSGSGSGSTPSTFPSTPFIMMPDGQFKLIWHAVPYSIFLDRAHPMYTYVAHVNQTTFFGWDPGQLLFMGASARRYVPTFPWYRQTLDGTTAFSAEKLCDITFNFQYTTREVTNPPDLEGYNGSWIPGGHNCQPWSKDRLFYTVTTASDPDSENAAISASWKPMYPSAPFQLLFQCPED